MNSLQHELSNLKVETPSWGYADSGTRFGIFAYPGAAKTLYEKLEDAAEVHRFTGSAPLVAIHIPWDKCDDYSEALKYANDLGIGIGALNPNLFQDPEYKFGSLGASDSARTKAEDHIDDCIGIMRKVGSKTLSLWFADGTNFPGQGDFRTRFQRFEESLARIHGKLANDETMLIEYKPFEPAFYSTDIPDWGTALLLAKKSGDNAKVLVDLGHHFHGQNIEQIVAILQYEKKLGGFHFNGRKYADDDLTTGSINPYELFLIMIEIVKGGSPLPAFMVDEMHSLKNKVGEMIQSLVEIQTAYLKALLVDFDLLSKLQAEEDLIRCEEVLKDAFQMDVREALTEFRASKGCPSPENPVDGFLSSGYSERVANMRSN